ncbi:MAG: signal peptidase II [Lachnospiraceae bacterium]|nr:signal peptidase II [Lachnospiraceae bacterium]MBQ6994491.1 signal peptidase II [Lachnospiraceae bacterium]
MKFTWLGVLLFITDGIIKLFVEKKGKKEVIKPLLGGKLFLRKYHNTGAMLGAGAKRPKRIALLSIIFTAFMTGVYVATLGYKGQGMLKTGLALLLGGAYSNTYDRLRRKYVVDYISFGVKGKLKNVIFNISDFGIILGAGLMVIGELLKE